MPVLHILSHGMKIGGILHTGGEQALASLALAFTEQLLPPFGKKAEGRFVAGQKLDARASFVKGVAGGGVAPGGVGSPGTSSSVMASCAPAIRRSMSSPAAARGRRPAAVSTE
jgi:hypothetical protein